MIAANDPALTLKPFAETIKGIDFAALKRGNPVDGTLNDVDKTFIASAVPGTNWLLVVALDNSDATSGMRSLLKASAISLVILALLSGAIVHVLIARLLKRLSDIRDAMHNIANGTNDLSQRLPDSGNDEVAQIAQAFNAFSDKLSVVMVQLRDASASVKMPRRKLRLATRIFPGVPSRRRPAFARPPARWSRSPPPSRNRMNRQRKRTIRQAKRLRLPRAVVKWFLRPSAQCSPSKWRPQNW